MFVLCSQRQKSQCVPSGSGLALSLHDVLGPRAEALRERFQWSLSRAKSAGGQISRDDQTDAAEPSHIRFLAEENDPMSQCRSSPPRSRPRRRSREAVSSRRGQAGRGLQPCWPPQAEWGARVKPAVYFRPTAQPTSNKPARKPDKPSHHRPPKGPGQGRPYPCPMKAAGSSSTASVK